MPMLLQQTLRRARAQSGIEMMITLGFLGAVMIGMLVYLQRGYHGYLFSNAAAHGLQFDITDNYIETNQLQAFTQKQRIDVVLGQQDVQLPQFKAANDERTSPADTPVPSRQLKIKVKTEIDWDIRRTGVYNASP
jgi:hypothetical protein